MPAHRWRAGLLGALVLALPAGAAKDEEALLAELRRHSIEERGLELGVHTADVGKLVPDLSFADLRGEPVRLADCAGASGLVIATRQIGCPVSDRSGPALAEIEGEFGPRGFGFLFVHVGPAPAAAVVVERELEGHGFRGTYVLDPDGALGRAQGLDTSTTVFVLDAARTLQYRGAIDDRFVGGLERPVARSQYLRDALDAVLEQRQPVVRATRTAGSRIDLEREDPGLPPEGPTYQREVARLLQANCVECHHAGGPAPFALDDYATAYDKRRMIAMVVREGIMPPWYASGEYGTWKGDRRLDARDRQVIGDWVEQGAPEGDPADAPAPYAWSGGWLIGEPDVVYQLAREQRVPAEGVVNYKRIPADRVVERDMWVERVQILPGDPRVVHHAGAIYFLPPPEATLRTALMPWSGVADDEPRSLGGYVPGRNPLTYRSGTACFVPKGSRIYFNMHYTPNGQKAQDLTRLGLVLARQEPDFEAKRIVIGRELDSGIDIGPGERASYEASRVVDEPVIVRSLSPHMHLRGVAFEADVTYPDGRQEELIRISEWDMDWQYSYLFAREPVLPTGAVIRIKGWYDNSADNRNNPDPAQRVLEGQQTWDEMLLMTMEWVRPRALSFH